MDRIMESLVFNQEKFRFMYFGIILTTIIFLIYKILKNGLIIIKTNNTKKEKLLNIIKNKYVFSLVLIIIPILLEIILYGNYKVNFDIDLYHRFIYEYTFLFLLWIYELWIKNSKLITKIFDFIIEKRYIIAIICFVLLVLLRVNFSSIGIWRNYTKQNTKTLLFGTFKIIRSDEWLVTTPFCLSQYYNGFERVNSNVNIGNNDMNILNAPVKDLSIIVKVGKWGYLLFGNDIGLSWQWSLKLIMMLLVYFEFGMIITKKDKGLSLLSSIWLTFSPAIMWWSMVDLFALAIGIIVLFHKYVSKGKELTIWKKILIAYLMLVFICNFVFSLYPAWQVPIAYFIIAFVIIDFIKYRKNLNIKDYLIMDATFLFSILFIIYFIITSWDGVQAIMSTKYPGARTELGGDYNFNRLTNYYINFFLPFSGDYPNQSEVSAYICPYIALVIMLVFYVIDTIKNKNLKAKIKNKNNWYFIGTLVVTFILLMWLGIRWPTIIAKITGLSNSPTVRAESVFELCCTILVIILAAKMFARKRKIFSKKLALIFSIVITIIVYFIATRGIYKDTFNSFKLFVVLLPIIFLMNYTFLASDKKGFIYLMILINLFAGATVNPISIGTASITDTDIAKGARSISSEDPDAIWAGHVNINSQYLIANGIKVINGINEYPNYYWIDKIDQEHKYEEVWNRYAHICIELSETTTNFELVTDDYYIVYMTYDDLKNLNIKYYYTFNRIDNEKLKDFNLKEIYSDTLNEQYIYEIN